MNLSPTTVVLKAEDFIRAIEKDSELREVYKNKMYWIRNGKREYICK